MSTDAAQNKQADSNVRNMAGDITVRIARPRTKLDLVTILGLLSAIGLIVFAISIGHSDANFVNGPSFLIVGLPAYPIQGKKSEELEAL